MVRPGAHEISRELPQGRTTGVWDMSILEMYPNLLSSQLPQNPGRTERGGKKGMRELVNLVQWLGKKVKEAK